MTDVPASFFFPSGGRLALWICGAPRPLNRDMKRRQSAGPDLSDSALWLAHRTLPRVCGNKDCGNRAESGLTQWRLAVRGLAEDFRLGIAESPERVDSSANRLDC